MPEITEIKTKPETAIITSLQQELNDYLEGLRASVGIVEATIKVVPFMSGEVVSELKTDLKNIGRYINGLVDDLSIVSGYIE